MNPGRILAKSILLSALLMTSGFLGCTSAHSVRSGLEPLSSMMNRQKTQSVIDSTYVTENNMYSSEERTEKGTYQTEKKGKNQKRMPTLDEQVKALEKEQTTIKEDITTIKSDISELKNAIEDLKKGVNVIYNNRIPDPQKGPEARKENNTSAKTGVAEGTFILPDEAENQANEAVKKQNVPQHTNRTSAKLPTGNGNEKRVIKEEKSEQTGGMKKAKIYNPNLKTERKQNKKAKKTDDLIAANNDFSPTAEYSEAIASISKKDYKGALEKLTRVITNEKNPAAVNNCNYWIGECYFGLGNYTQAMDYFSKVLRSKAGAKKDNAQIMIAESQVRTGNIQGAKKTFASLIEKFPESEFAPRARKMLQML